MKQHMNWKSIWQMVSGLHQDTTSEKVKGKLIEIKGALQDGLLQFRTNESGSDAQLEKVLKEAKQDKLLPFTRHLQKYLNLDADQTWTTLCSYLVNEYKGSPGSLAVYVSNEANKCKLLADIWNYYSLERMIILKLIKCLLEFQRDKRHPYHVAYTEVVQQIGLKVLKGKILDQLTAALKDDPDASSGYSMIERDHDTVKRGVLVGRKLREINELLQLLILIGQLEESAVPDELKLLLNIFKNSSFLQKCKYSTTGESAEQLQKIEHSRVVLLLFYIHHCPGNIKAWNPTALQDVDDAIGAAQQCVENAPLFLAWMIKNFKALGTDESLNESISPRSYQNFGAKAIKLEVFRYLWAILQTKTYENRPPSMLANTARRTIYNTLNDLCDLFDSDGSVAQHSCIYDLLAELLTTPSIAVDFMRAHGEEEARGCVSLYNTAVELFPSEFVPISKIAAALAGSGTKNGSEFIKAQLESLPVFTELCSGKQYDVQPLGTVDAEDEFILTKDYYPMRQFALKVPRGTRVAIMDRRKLTYVHFWHPCNYFHVLHNEIRELMTTSGAEEAPLIARVTSGVNYLRHMLTKLKSPTDITDSMVHPVEMVFDLLVKFKAVPLPPVALMASCLDVCAALSAFFDQEVLKRVLNLGIFPTVSNTGFSHEEYARGTGFDSGLIGQYLINYENGSGTYPFLKSYFNFLSTYKRANVGTVFPVELPALVFMLREIFPHCHTWRFEKEADLHEIYVFVMEYFFEVLQLDDAAAGPEKKLLRDTCVFSLLNLENGLTLLKFVGIGNPFLQSKMEAEPNWSSAITAGLNHIVQLSMTILMQILRTKANVTGENVLSPLETIIYTQPKQRDTLRIIPVVTSYMNNFFNKRLPILSCRLLRRFAIEFQMSLLACLDMEQDHIRMTFLQRLRDDTGSNELKIAILEFVEACLSRQPGLVEAFFDIRYDMEKKRPKLHTEGIPAYMEEYLDAIAKEPEKVGSPLLSRIMSLFHVVWRNNMQSLIRNLIESKSFWSSLCTPLFMQINQRSLKVYSQLFNILGLEVFKYQGNDLSPALEAALKKFLDLTSFDLWLKYLLNSQLESSCSTAITATDETPEWLCRMQSFKDFLCIVIKKKPHLVSSKARCLLLNRLIIEILKRIEDVNRSDSRAMVILTELYLLVLVNSDSQKYTDSVADDKRLFNDVAQILGFLASSYEDIIPRVQIAILGFSLRIVQTYSEELGLYSDIGTHLVQSTMSIICQELAWVENGLAEEKTNVPLLLSLQVLQKLLMINNENRFFDWDSVSVGPKILFRFLGSLQRICPKYADRKVTLALLEVLTSIARTLDTNEFLFCDIGDYLWLKLLPPKSLLRDPFQKTAAQLKQEDWVIQEWWPIYDQGIELVTALLQKHGSLFVSQAITFLGIHEDYLMDSMHLVRESLEPRAMSLIKKTVGLICECTRFRKTWQLEHSQSICNLMRSIQILTEQLISLMYRPNLLKMLLDGRPSDNGLVDLSAPIAATPELVSALNGVIEIIISCIKALLTFSPPLMELICGSNFIPSQWHALIDIQFGAPKFNDSVQQLSFGTLLSAVGTFTKTLGLIQFTFHDSPLNFTPADSSVAEATPSACPPSVNTMTNRSKYNKSVSVSSSGFGNQPLANCNEILSSLDGKLCMAALEYILTLLLSQSYLAIRDVHLSAREKQLIKRELSAELGILNEFLKKKLSLENIGTLQRKKYGSSTMHNDLGDVLLKTDRSSSSQQQQQQSSQRRLSQPRDSMRVNVVRRLHLQQKVLPSVLGSTPRREGQSQANFENITPIKRTGEGGGASYTDEGGDIEYVGLSTVNIVEADYLHLLSNMFAVVCHSDK